MLPLAAFSCPCVRVLTYASIRHTPTEPHTVHTTAAQFQQINQNHRAYYSYQVIATAAHEIALEKSRLQAHPRESGAWLWADLCAAAVWLSVNGRTKLARSESCR